ncbi:5'-amp-activated protein kinase subunit beta, partial [Globisporangium splendens]
MGSTSSKEHDANPSELGTNASGGGGSQYPLHHYPHYGQQLSSQHLQSPRGGTQQQYHDNRDANMYNSGGHDPYYSSQKGGGAHDHQQRMYQSQETSSDPKRELMFGSSRGPNGNENNGGANEAMDIDHPSSSSDLSYMSNSLPTSQLDEKGGSLESDNGLSSKNNEVVPMVFRWEHGGRNVYITGTFNGWSKQCPMHRSGNDFTYIANLTRGKHAYKFVVDDEWRFAPDQLTVADVEGNVNNFVDVSEFTPLSDFEGSPAHDDKDENGENAYGRFIPDIDEYTKEPPPLPPHLRHIILNKTPPTVDSRLLPVPQHVALNHLYCTAIKDGMMVLGITNRYKQKFVTTVYYSLMPGTN